jgi:hypothetical protein
MFRPSYLLWMRQRLPSHGRGSAELSGTWPNLSDG